MWVQALEDWTDLIENQGMGAWSAMMMRRRFYAGALSRAASQWFESQQATAGATCVLGAVDVLVGMDLSEDLHLAAMPTLILHLDNSPFIPVSVVSALKDGLPDARLHVFSHARHGLPFSHARACSALTSQFIADHD